MFTKKMSARMLTVAGATALVLGCVSGALAATATDDLDVTATVTANCTISTTAVDFGAYDPIVTHASANSDAAGALSVNCTTGANATITLGQGTNAAGGSTDAAPARRMTDGAGTPHYIAYSLYTDSGRTTAWGNTSGTGQAYVGTGGAETVDVFGRIAGGQNVPAGNYADLVVATITF